MRITTVLCTAGLMLLAGGAAAQDVNYDYDRRANFAAYRTYAWVSGTRQADDLNHARIVAAVDRQLAAKGLTQVDSTGTPDVLVLYRVALHRRPGGQRLRQSLGRPLWLARVGRRARAGLGWSGYRSALSWWG